MPTEMTKREFYAVTLLAGRLANANTGQGDGDRAIAVKEAVRLADELAAALEYIEAKA